MARYRYVDPMWNLRSKPVVGKRRDQTKHCLWRQGRDRDPIWIADRPIIGKPVKPPANSFDLSRVPQLIKRPWMDAQPNCVRGANGLRCFAKMARACSSAYTSCGMDRSLG